MQTAQCIEYKQIVVEFECVVNGLNPGVSVVC